VDCAKDLEGPRRRIERGEGTDSEGLPHKQIFVCLGLFQKNAITKASNPFLPLQPNPVFLFIANDLAFVGQLICSYLQPSILIISVGKSISCNLFILILYKAYI
jgi:hypothetical protein